MKNTTYHTAKTIPKSYIEIVEKVKVDSPTHKYMTAHFLDLLHALR